MDKKQHLLLVIALMVFGVSLASAIFVFSKKNVTAHRDELVSEITQVGADAFQYMHRPKLFGGGGGSYTGYRVPEKLRTNEHAAITVSDSAGDKLTIVATSSLGIGSVAVKIDQIGTLQDFAYTGEFME